MAEHAGVEHEVKLEFADADAARAAVTAAGATVAVARRELRDTLYDTPDRTLRLSGRALRLRRDGPRGLLTVKGPVQSGPVKSRQERETPVDDPAATHALLTLLGYEPWFEAAKHREEYRLDDALLTVDETPVGVFVEIEAAPDRIEAIAKLLGRTPADYLLTSYPALYRERGYERQRRSGRP